jgi:hypothetical protein
MRGKNDSIDAAAIHETVQRPPMPVVLIQSVEQHTAAI